MCTYEVENHVIPGRRIHRAQTSDIWSVLSSDLITRWVDLFAEKRSATVDQDRRITQAAYAYYVGFTTANRLLNVGYRSSQGSHGRVLQKLRDVDPCAQLFSQIAPVPCRNTVPLTCFLPRCLRLAEALEDSSFAVHAEPKI